MALEIEILISTYNERANQIDQVLLQPISGISYLVVHQCTKNLDLPLNFLDRDDVRYYKIKSKGVTISRNHAINNAKGDIIIFSDDDVSYEQNDLENVSKIFQDNPNVDVGIFKIKTPAGSPTYENYHSSQIEIKTAPSVGTIQLAVRLESLRKSGVFFDERFGCGNSFLIGSDEQIFLHDCLKAGMKVVYFPYYMVSHPYESTSKLIPPFDERRVRVLGGLDARMNGWIALPKAVLGTFKYWSPIKKERKSPLNYFWNRWRAAFFILNSQSINKNKS
jgi:glycosyltransferase involved in cell wall biosynthesis